MTATLLALCLLAYLSGAIPWSVWLGRAFYGVDVRAVADGNPGATNAYRAGGWKLGAAVVLLDFFKAFVPVLIARWGVRLPGEQVFLVALLPTVGHAFSIFLRFRGGRALASMFGAWSGLTLYEVPLVMGGAAIVSTFALKNDAQRALAVPAAALAYVLVRGRPAWMVALAVAQIAVLAVKLVVHARAPRRPLPET
ncbi:MAG: glycerol-3-phosphate acyltransferase [Chloroflexi bacterium]|nr:glycerol-3-phosphate acyltransferase [Chloroflexota bacterium]